MEEVLRKSDREKQQYNSNQTSSLTSVREADYSDIESKYPS